MAEVYVNFIMQHAVPRAMTLDDIRAATATEPCLRYVCNQLTTGRWHDTCPPNIDHKELTPFYQIRNELSLTSDGSILLRGNHIIMPKSLQKRALELDHEGHQGLTKTGLLWLTPIRALSLQWLSYTSTHDTRS